MVCSQRFAKRDKRRRHGAEDTVAICDAAHAQYDRFANGPAQVGTLPAWTRVQGKVVWLVAQGPLDQLSGVWQGFHAKAGAVMTGRPDGPPGEVFVCPPEAHAADHQAKLLTILYLPIA